MSCIKTAKQRAKFCWPAKSTKVIRHTISHEAETSFPFVRAMFINITLSRIFSSQVFVVVGVFFVCFAPFHMARVPYTLTQTRGPSAHCWDQKMYLAKEITLWLSATNICLDPLIYVFLCRVFRRKLTATLCHKPLANGGLESPTETSTKQEMSHMGHYNNANEFRSH